MVCQRQWHNDLLCPTLLENTMKKARSFRLLALLALTAALGACGYKGPLYHPPAEQAQDADTAPR